eukprot:scaffold1159_cov215-Pinguiococcus_pyrenoidosus.AAC.17
MAKRCNVETWQAGNVAKWQVGKDRSAELPDEGVLKLYTIFALTWRAASSSLSTLEGHARRWPPAALERTQGAHARTLPSHDAVTSVPPPAASTAEVIPSVWP